LHDFVLIPAISRSLGAHPHFPDRKPEPDVTEKVGGKEEDWRSLPLQSLWSRLYEMLILLVCGAI